MNQQQLNETFDKLTPRRQEVLRLVLAGELDEAIAQVLLIQPATVRKYLERLYRAFDVTKKSELVTLFAKYKPELINGTSHQILPVAEKSSSNTKQDLGEAPHTVTFYGRTEELATLRQWIVNERCRIVGLLGMGGLGKTALSVKLAAELKSDFDYIIWRSLREAPKLETILNGIIKFLSNQEEINTTGNIHEKITRLLEHLRSSRCLLILDNFESILADGSYGEQYRDEYQDYSILIQRIGELHHQSCLVFTSRIKPKKIAMQEGENLLIDYLPLPGLKDLEVMKILEAKKLTGTDQEIQKLVRLYSGNPLALKIVSTFIQDLFSGNVSEFLSQEITLTPFVGIESLLEQQFTHLTELEQEIMYWLAINREPVSPIELFEDITEKPIYFDVINALENLKRCSLIEAADGKFTLQNVVLEYMTGILIRQVSKELNSGQTQFINRFALAKATAQDYVRNSQIQLIIKPIAKNVNELDAKLVKFLEEQKQKIRDLPKGYLVGNILDLLRYHNYNLSGLDLSNFTVWQAYLRGADLRDVKFVNADLNKTRFTESFGIVLAVAYNSKKSMIALGDTKSEVRLRDAKGHQLLTLEGHTNWIRSVAFSPDGEILVSGSDDKTVRLWNTTTGQFLRSLQGHKERVWSVAFSPDGKTVASSSEDKTVRLWNVHTAECWKILEKHTHWVREVAFSPDGKILASGSSDRTVILWDAHTGNYIRTLEGQHTARVRTVAFSSDGRILASGSDDHTIRLWDIHSGKYLQTLLGHRQRVRSLAFSPEPNSRILASASEDHKVILWDIDANKRYRTLSEHTEKVWSVTFTDPEGKTLISSSDDKTVKFWDTHTGECLKTLQGYTDWAWSLVFHPSGNILISGNDDKTIKLWNLDTGESKSLAGHSNRIRAVALSPDSSMVASGSDDQTIKLWDTQTGQHRKTLVDHFDRILTVAFSPDGRYLASGGDDKILRIWNIHSGEYRQTQENHKNWLWSVTFSPDSSILASGSEDCTIKLWDVDTGKCFKTLFGHDGWVRSVRFSPDGNTLVSGSEDHTIKLWDVTTGECIQTLKGKTGWVRTVAFSPKGRFVASAGGNPIIEIWDIKTAKLYRTLSGHQERIWSVVFSADGQTLASSSEDGTIMLWHIETGELKKTLRSPRLCEGMDITGVVNLTEAQIKTLKTLGAKKDDE
ncbi:NB-ARC domain-containing protein [Nostoc sp. LPT]|uniref:WD40 domain-containing protein n=1 Tax=Nostoc sp. LPT TaxID=2815387 RepID=UPI001D5EB9D8|nr:NB-ARC domain-containing protein [Nostoc sp. LPT]MBN4003713.1 pentapeptide repeat-containing protein [Nostoc sp. LPT]